MPISNNFISNTL